MDTVLYLLALLLALGAFMYWFRGYLPGLRRGFARLRGVYQLYRQLRGARGGSGGVTRGPFPPRSRTIDVEATPAAGRREICRVCGDALSSAQLSALRQNDIRCVGSGRVGKPCPYRKYN